MQTFNCPGSVKMAKFGNIVEGMIIAIDYDRKFAIVEFIGDERPRTLEFNEMLYISLDVDIGEIEEIVVYDSNLTDITLPVADAILLKFVEDVFGTTLFQYRIADVTYGSRDWVIEKQYDTGKFRCSREMGLPVECDTVIQALIWLAGALDRDFKYPM